MYELALNLGTKRTAKRKMLKQLPSKLLLQMMEATKLIRNTTIKGNAERRIKKALRNSFGITRMPDMVLRLPRIARINKAGVRKVLLRILKKLPKSSHMGRFLASRIRGQCFLRICSFKLGAKVQYVMICEEGSCYEANRISNFILRP